MQNRTNRRRLDKEGKRFFPSHVYSMSSLRHGSLDGEHPAFHSLADFHVSENRVEIRIPWCQLNFTDPSSRAVLWADREGKTRTTEGIRFLAYSYGAGRRGAESGMTDSLPAKPAPDNVRPYSWTPWDTPAYHMYLKKSYYVYKEVLSAIPEGA